VTLPRRPRSDHLPQFLKGQAFAKYLLLEGLPLRFVFDVQEQGDVGDSQGHPVWISGSRQFLEVPWSVGYGELPSLRNHAER